PRGMSGSSNWRGCTMLPDGPPTTAARIGRPGDDPPPTGSVRGRRGQAGPPRARGGAGRPVDDPPPTVSISVRSVQPSSISTTPGRFRCPERPKSFVPRPPPRLANHAPPRATIDGTADSVSTLLMTVGLPKSPASTGNRGRGGGTGRA